MKKAQLAKLPANLRVMGIGGTLGTTVSLWVYFTVPSVAASVPIQVFSTLGASSGAALFKAMCPVTRKISHYVMIWELRLHVRNGWLSEDQARSLMQKRLDAYFGNKDAALS